MDAITIEQEIAAKQEFQKAWLIALDERDAARTYATMRRAEADELRKQVVRLTTCDCGLPLSAGQCGICDNDE